jgi:hypothetical protein
MIKKIDIDDLLDLVRLYSTNYRNSEAFRISLDYFRRFCNQQDRIKDVLYQELCESIGEDFANIEIENKLSE